MSNLSESTLSQASTKVGDEIKEQDDTREATPRTRKAISHVAHAATAQDILLFLVAFRILNALTIRTFFQPDEYFQSLEPAWQMAFGKDSGAWITWVGVGAWRHESILLTACQEWRNQLRSAIHPAIFATVYWTSDVIATALQLSPSIRAELLLAAPKTLQAIFAAIGDYYTWKLAERIHGHGSSQAWAALALTVVNPWQWFVSTRTLSNCVETTLTIIALYNWPYHWSLRVEGEAALQVDGEGLRIRDADNPSQGSVDETTRLRRALLFAAVATIMRPTNILIWTTLVLSTLLQHTSSGWLMKIPWTDQSAWVHTTHWSFVPNRNERFTLFRETIVCGTLVFVLSLLVDRFYYQAWALPPLNFLYFNVVQSLSIFYGNNNWHYYLSEGYPLLLTTALPFALIGVYNALSSDHIYNTQPASSRTTLSQLANISLIVPFALSMISHKEVRFIYPLLPALHILAALPVSSFFGPAIEQSLHNRPASSRPSMILKRITLLSLLAVNATIGFYTATTHNSGLITVENYLRHQDEIHYLHSSPPSNMTVGYLMPCHSTPWRSHLQYPPTQTTPGISAWALTCEPPLRLNATARAMYLDEADIFYANPIQWLRNHMSRNPPRMQSIFGSRNASPRGQFQFTPGGVGAGGRREWPDYLIFFQQLENVMQTALQGSGYGECWRGFNSHWHDDRRRTGDVVVWCLDVGEQKKADEARVRRHSSSTEGLWGRARNLTSKMYSEAEDVVQQVHRQSVSHKDGKTLGGGRGPYGIGIGNNGDLNKQKAKEKVAGVRESTVERPFWKIREKAVKEVDTGFWSKLRPLSKPQKKTSWWKGGKWS